MSSRDFETLYYQDLKVTVEVKVKDATWLEPADYDDVTKSVDWDYNVSVDMVKDALGDILVDDYDAVPDDFKNEPDIKIFTAKINNYVDENYEELFDRYYDDLLAWFEDDAREEVKISYYDNPEEFY